MWRRHDIAGHHGARSVSRSHWAWLGTVVVSAVLALSWLLLQADVRAASLADEYNVLINIGQGNGHSSALSLSADGRMVAFASDAGDLLADDTNQVSDVFIYNHSTKQINRASLTNSGAEANGPSYLPSLSADGRFVAFESDAGNLVLDGSTGYRHIFVRDLISGETERISISSDGTQANGDSFAPSISGDGRYVVYESDATVLVAGDTNESRDIFIHDRHQNTTHRISVDNNGIAGNRDSYQAVISTDGRYVVYESLATNLVPHDNNSVTDIFLHTLQTGTTQRLSNGYGGAGNGPSTLAAISATGDFIAFRSFASNLVPNDVNNSWDVFVYDRSNHTLERVSVATNGTAGNPAITNPDVAPARPAISADGRYMLFQSDATNLVLGDTNGRMDIFLRDRQSGTTERVSVRDSGEQAADHASAPALSEDGRYLAFLSAATLTRDESTGFRSLFYRARQAPPPTATPTRTATPLATPTPTATVILETSPTPTATSAASSNQRHLMLPLVAVARPLAPPTLREIDSGYANGYVVQWTATRAGRNVSFTLLESSNADFSDATVVYMGPNHAWPAANKAPGQYFYRVKLHDGAQETNWSQTQQVLVHPLFVGLHLRWQGSGVIGSGTDAEVGYTWEERLDSVDGRTIQSKGRQWYAPNPQGWPEETWTSTFDVTTGAFLGSSLPPGPEQRWGHPWILPYGLMLESSSAVSIDGQIFTITGPHAGVTAFGVPVTYWRLVNRDRFLYWEDDSGVRQYVEPGGVELWYDSGQSGLLLRQDLIRRVYQGSVNTGETIRYSLNLVETNAFFN